MVIGTKTIIFKSNQTMKNFRLILAGLAFYGTSNLCLAQHDHHEAVDLHVNPRWDECSIQLDPSLTQKAWRQFTAEAALVTYFRPLTDAKPMGVKNFEISILQWETGIDDTEDAWNDTFVHPDSTHWLIETPRLAFPGLTVRAGVTDKIDVGVYFTKSVGANYGFFGAQVQYNLVNNLEKKWAAAARAGFMTLYGPDDVNQVAYGLDLIASKEFPVYSDRVSFSPYVGVSTYLSHAHEKSAVVDLNDENVTGGQGMIGAVLKLSFARFGVEYNLARVNTFSYKIGVTF